MKLLANLATYIHTYILASPASFCTKCLIDRASLQQNLTSVYLYEFPFIYHKICIFFKARSNLAFRYYFYYFCLVLSSTHSYRICNLYSSFISYSSLLHSALFSKHLVTVRDKLTEKVSI